MARLINDIQTEQAAFTKRYLLAGALIIIFSLLILTRYAYLQIFEFEKYHTQSENNRVHLNAIPPSRGRIYARDGAVLAQNFPSFVVTVIRGRMSNVEKELRILQKLLHLDEEKLNGFKRRLHQYRAYDAVPMKYELTERERAVIAANRHLLPGISITVNLIRQYPYGELVTHALGYVGRISEKDQKRLEMKKYQGSHHTGKLGLERFYEQQLHGDIGYEQVETDVRGKVLRLLERTEPKSGKDLSLFLDLKTQQKATELLQGEVGAVVAIDTRSGGIVSFVSMPSYDANAFVNGISFKDYGALRDSIDLPLFNRALQGLYPPASTIKPFIALAGLELGYTDKKRRVRDPGYFQLPNDKRKYRDWKRGGHGYGVDLDYAIKQSCDVYFYDLAYRMGIDNMGPFLRSFGFGHQTGIDLPSERSGLVPSKAWKKKNRKRSWYPGDTVNAGIGQGYMQSTPLQLAVGTAVIANRGRRIIPRMVKEINGKQTPLEELPALVIKDEYWDGVIKAMEGVLHSSNGTARRAGHLVKFHMAGKTGTAQVVGIKQNERYDSDKLKKKQRDHALFMGFAPVDDPRVAVAVIVENGESGGGKAAPIAIKVAETYLKTLKAEGDK